MLFHLRFEESVTFGIGTFAAVFSVGVILWIVLSTA